MSAPLEHELALSSRSFEKQDNVEFPESIDQLSLLDEGDFKDFLNRAKPLPCNAGLRSGLDIAVLALTRLDEARCLVVGIEIGFESAVIKLARAPSESLAVKSHHATYTGYRGDRIHILRGSFLGATLEWREGT